MYGVSNVFPETTIAARFAGSASLEYRCAGQPVRVLVDDPLYLPELRALCWIALSADLRKAAVSEAGQPIQRWLSELLGEPLVLTDVVLGAQQFEGELLLTRLSQDSGEQPDCWFAVQTQLRFQLGAQPPAISDDELRSIQIGDFIRLQRHVLKLGNRTVFELSLHGKSAILNTARRVFCGAESNTSEPFLDALIKHEMNFIIQIAPLSIPLNALLKRPPDYRFTLPVALEGNSVTVTLDGVVAGRGRLICIGEVSGVRITEWAGASQHEQRFS